MKPFILGFLLSTLIYIHALNLTVRYYKSVIALHGRTVEAMGNTCQQWYDLVKPRKKRGAPSGVMHLTSGATFAGSQ